MPLINHDEKCCTAYPARDWWDQWGASCTRHPGLRGSGPTMTAALDALRAALAQVELESETARRHEGVCIGSVCFESDDTGECACWCHVGGAHHQESAPTPRTRAYTEWRVTGQPNPVHGVEFPPYDFTWSPARTSHLGEAQEQARAFIAGITASGFWSDGPHLHCRTVTVTEWEEVS